MIRIRLVGADGPVLQALAERFDALARAAGQRIRLDRLDSASDVARALVRYGLTALPAVVINGRVVWSGSLPDEPRIAHWLQSISASSCGAAAAPKRCKNG
jgi:hypothetical protein